MTQSATSAKPTPFITFSRENWAALRLNTPMTLDEEDLERLRGINVNISMNEVEEIYLPLSRLLNLYIAATQSLHTASAAFLGNPAPKVPYVIGIGGSVAVGKSTTARILQALLSRWPNHPKVDLITTDGFLLPNQILENRQLMERKGFPESYDVARLLRFVSDVKAGKQAVAAPVYSHLNYDIIPGEEKIIDQPDIMILEGLNVLQPGNPVRDQRNGVFVSDFFDFSIYVDAEIGVIEEWYVDRFLTFRDTAFKNPGAYFHRYANLSDSEARETALDIWKNINEKNLVENIGPTRGRADLILIKADDHQANQVLLRKL